MDLPVKDEPLQPVDFPINPGFKKDLECDDSIEITHSIEITLGNLNSSHIQLALVLGKIRQAFKDNQNVSRVPNDFKLKLQKTCRFLNSIAEELKAIAGKCDDELTKVVSTNKLHNFETYAWEDVEENVEGTTSHAEPLSKPVLDAPIEIISPVGSPVASKSEEDSAQVFPCEKAAKSQPLLPSEFKIHTDQALHLNPARIQFAEDPASVLLGNTPRENAPEINPDVCQSTTSCQNLPQPNCNFLEAPPAAAAVVPVLYVNPTNSPLKESRKRQPAAAKSPKLSLEGQSVKRPPVEQNSHAAAESPTPQEKSQDAPASNGNKDATTNGHDPLELSFQTRHERETCNSTAPPSVSSLEHVAVAPSSQMDAAPSTSQKGNMYVREAPQDASLRVLSKRKIVPPARYQGHHLPKKTAKPPKSRDSNVQSNLMCHAGEKDQATEQKSYSGEAPPKNSSSTEHSKKIRFCESVKEFTYNASLSLTEASTGTCLQGSTRQIVLKDTPSKPRQKRRQSQNHKRTKNRGRTYPTVETQVLLDPTDPPAPVIVNQAFSGNNQSHEAQSTTSNSNDSIPIPREIPYTSSLSQIPVTSDYTGLQKVLIKKLPSGELKSSLVPSSHVRQLEPCETSLISESTTRDPAPEPSSGPEVIHLKQLRIILNRLSPQEVKKYLVPETQTPQLSPCDIQSRKHEKEISPVSDLPGVKVHSTASRSSTAPSTSSSSLQCSSATDNSWSHHNYNSSGDTIKIDKTPETCDDIDIINYSDEVIELHRDRPEKCAHCLRSFSSLTELKAHIDAKHSGVKSPERLSHEPVLITESGLQAAEAEPTLAPSASTSEGPGSGNSFPSKNFQSSLETPCPDQLPNDISATKENEAIQINRDPLLQCGYCPLTYKQLKLWLWHYKIKHPHNVPSRCPNCREKISIESADGHVCINV